MEFLVCSVLARRTIVLSSCKLLFLLHQIPAAQHDRGGGGALATNHYTSVSLVVIRWV